MARASNHASATPPSGILRARGRREFSACGVTFLAERFGPWRAVVTVAVPQCPQLTARAWQDASAAWTAEEPAEDPDARVLKDAASSEVVHCSLQLGGERHEVIIKSSRPTTLLKRAGSVWRGPKEYREFWMGHRLRAAGVRTPLPLACLWRPAPPLGLAGRIVTELVPDARGLDEIAVRLAAPTCTPTDRHRAAGRLAERLANLLHGLGAATLYHRDLKASNIMVSGTAAEPDVWLIDTDGVAPDSAPFGAGHQRCIARLVGSLMSYPRVTTRDLRRGLRHLMAARQMTDWKAQWRGVGQLVQHLLERKGRRKDGTKLAGYE